MFILIIFLPIYILHYTHYNLLTITNSAVLDTKIKNMNQFSTTSSINKPINGHTDCQIDFKLCFKCFRVHIECLL